MFPTQNFTVQVTDERLLSPKRGTIKRSAKTRDYSLQKTATSIIINPALPYDYKDYLLGFVEGEIDLTNKNEGEYQLEVGVKSMYKFIIGILLLVVPFQIYLLIFRFETYSIFNLFLLLFFFASLFYQYYQARRGVELMSERLKEDKSIFIGA